MEENPIMCICFMNIHKGISVLSWLDFKSVSSDMHIDFEDVAALSMKHSWFLAVLSLRLISHITVWWPFNSCELDSISLELESKEKKMEKQMCWTSAVLRIVLCMKCRLSDSKTNLFFVTSLLRNTEEAKFSFKIMQFRIFILWNKINNIFRTSVSGIYWFW